MRCARRQMKSQSVSLFWTTMSSLSPLGSTDALSPFSLQTFLTMSEIVTSLNVRCLRERIMRCDLS